MAPHRSRLVIDDARSEASSFRDRSSGIPSTSAPSKARRNGNHTVAGTTLKDVISVAQFAAIHQEVQEEQEKVDLTPALPSTLLKQVW